MIAPSDLAHLLVTHHHVEPGETGADLLAGLLIDEAERDASAGRPARSLVDLIAQAKATFGTSFFGTPTSPPAELRRLVNLTERVAMEARAAQASTVTSVPNPWSTAGWSITAQVAMEHRDPARAAKLKAAAKGK